MASRKSIETGNSKQIVCGQYVADYSTTECRTFRPEGLCQLRTKLHVPVSAKAELDCREVCYAFLISL